VPENDQCGTQVLAQIERTAPVCCELVH
jgi:hypothetical protein